MTRLVLNSGHKVEVGLSIDEFADLLEDALQRGSLLELSAPDGRRLLISPGQVALAEGIGEGAPTRRLSPATVAG